MGLLHDYFRNFSTRGERYCFHVEGSMRSEIELTPGEIETNIEKVRNSEKILGWREVLELNKSSNELFLDLHISESPRWNSSLLKFLIIN